MHSHQYVERFVNLLDSEANFLFNATVEEAIECVGSGDPARVRALDGQFALVHRNGNIIRMARSIGRPLRYFLAKQVDGPCLIVAERMDQILDWLKHEGLDAQFHPSYTRMVPAHHIVEIALLGCPDPNPTYTRYFTPERNRLSTSLDEIGYAYIAALETEIAKWLDQTPSDAPLGVLFSGGVDSGAVFCAAYDCLLKRGESPARLKAFTLSIDDHGRDAEQAHQFLRELGLSLFLEVVDVSASEIDYREAVRVMEDYKPLDVQAAAMGLALCREIRARYPDWVYLLDGDGGDENLKDYPIEENSELTIRSVLNNLMLYHEGWGINAVKHSLTYSGGQSRGHVRSWAPARHFGFRGFSPFALPNVIEVSEGIPFVDLTSWDNEKLYSLKGEIVRRGVEQVTGLKMPVFEKRRFQHGATVDSVFESLFPKDEESYRDVLRSAFSVAGR
ncbi:MAG: asparagine synthetase B family protein [Planctomycetaceae bacterium]|nr:asparagine synthetase B family protein [Planctomycetaceae bacterium]